MIASDVPSPRVWLEVKPIDRFSAEASKSVASLYWPFLAQSVRRLSAVVRSGGLWLWGPLAGGWYLVIFRGLTILCMEGVLAPGSVGGCVRRMCGCLLGCDVPCSWCSAVLVLYAASAHYHPLPLSPLLHQFHLFARGSHRYCLTAFVAKQSIYH